MNKTNKSLLLKSIFVIFAIILIANTVFAANPGQKGSMSELVKKSYNKGVSWNGGASYSTPTDLHITEVVFKKYDASFAGGNCGEVQVKTNLGTNSSDKGTALTIGIFNPRKEKYNYPNNVEKMYHGDEGTGLNSIKYISDWGITFSPEDKKIPFVIYIPKSMQSICNGKYIDVYVFKPQWYGWNLQNEVYFHYEYQLNGNTVYGTSNRDLENSKDLLFMIGGTWADQAVSGKTEDGKEIKSPVTVTIKYFFNVDYAYGVPVTSTATTVLNSELPKESDIKVSQDGSVSESAQTAPTDIACEDKCPGYKTSSVYPSTSLTFNGKTFTKGQLCYGCNDDKTMIGRCDPSDGTKGDFDITTASGPGLNLKNEGICDVSSGTAQDNNLIAPQPINLDFSVFSSVSDISYITTTTTQYKARKVDTPESYLIDYKNNNKSISVNLASFSTGPVYVILAKPDQKDKIYGYLANIKSTGEFKNYTPQTAFTIDSTNLITNPAAMQYTLGADKTFKFYISGNAVDKLVLIFMQKSAGGLMVNLAYTNLYNLDYSEQSTYQLCEINKKIVSFYCTGYECNVPGSCIDRWDFDASKLDGIQGIPVDAIPGAPTTPVTPTPPVTTTEPPVTNASTLTFTGTCSITKQETVEKYIECLRRNIEIIDLGKKYALVEGGKQKGSPILGNTLIDNKYNTNELCYTSQPFNEAVFKAAKKANLTEEETAQLWSRIAAESGCDSKCSIGKDCGSMGMAQINVAVWKNSQGYNSLKKYLLEIDSTKYDTLTKYYAELDKVLTNPDSAVEISIAINKYHKSVIVSDSKNATRPLTDNLDKEYDLDDSIDMEFATAYGYTGLKYAHHFTSGITKGVFNVNRYQGVVFVALHKMGYYLTYKRMIYLCHNDASTSNAFVTAYKNVYGGKYCK